MAKKQYRFNPHTLTYEVVNAPYRLRVYRLVRKLIIGFIMVCIVNLLFSSFFYTPKMRRITDSNNELMLKYNILNDKIRAASQKLYEIGHRDKNVYRALFAADTLILEGGYTGMWESYADDIDNSQYKSLIASTWQGLDDITWRTYSQSVSLDQLQELSQDKNRMAVSIPAIWPIDKRKLRGSIGAYGRRLHPIYHRYIQHEGIDLAGKIGDPIYATGNATVSLTDNGQRSRGYGKQILLDHEFGYQTRYAHLDKILVKPGQKVIRGELIGYLGNSGGTTGPHLHYEVIYMGRTVDPINYFRRDMDEAELQRIIENARATTYETDL